jgi:hypothetical protein
MNRSAGPTDIVTLSSRSGVVLAAIPVLRRRTPSSDGLVRKLARRILRPTVSAMTVERRPVPIENDEVDRAALEREGLSGGQERFRGGAPRNLGDSRYDFLRQLR